MSRTERARRRHSIAVAVLCLVPAAPAAGEVLWGVRGSAWVEDSDPALGIEWLVPVGPRHLYLNPNLEAVFSGVNDRLVGNLDLHYDVLREPGFTGWLGGGLAIIHHDRPPRGEDNTDAGLNLLAGVGWQRQGLVPYVQLKAVLADDSELVASIGVRF